MPQALLGACSFWEPDQPAVLRIESFPNAKYVS